MIVTLVLATALVYLFFSLTLIRALAKACGHRANFR